MNSNRITIPLMISGCIMGTLFSGCTPRPRNHVPQVDIWSADTTVYLRQDEEKPSCKIYMELAYLTQGNETDSLTYTINANIQKQAFGEKYATYPPSDFGRKLLNGYISDYNTGVKKLYEEDLRHGMKESDIPTWYNYEYETTSSLDMGRDSIWNYTLTEFSYTGGAHPNTQKKMLNIKATSGQILHKEDVFCMEQKEKIEGLILKQLIIEMNKRLATDSITSLESLNEAGILLDGELNMPDNFLVGKNGITFYYNRYEIAPYSAGDFTLTIPYDEIEPYLKK